MSDAIRHPNRRRLRAAVAVTAIGALAVVALQARSGGSGSADALGEVVDPPTGEVATYSITYRTVFGDGDPVEELVEVVRPFRSRVTSGRTGQITDAGVFATTSDGQAWLRIAVPIAPAAPDPRPLAALPDAIDSGMVSSLGPRSVQGRDCEAYEIGGPLSSGVFTPIGALRNESAEVCIDRIGLVLTEVWTIDGAVVRTREAISIDFDPIDPDRFTLPSTTTDLAFEDGGGAVRAIDPVADPGFVEYWVPARVPTGFAFVERWAVAPPAIDANPDPAFRRSADVAVVTDAWRRGGDLLLLDQGAGKNDTGPPWNPDDPASDVDLGALGVGRLVVDLHLSEVRVIRPDGGFVRLAGTLPPAELVAAARNLVRATGGTP